MPTRRVVVRDAPAPLVSGLQRLADSLELPGDFPEDVLAEAEETAHSGPRDGLARSDRTEIPFVTIDPAGSTDLDQAVHIERLPHGYRVWYAIADVAAWVRPGGAIDSEAHRRGQTYYAPTTRVPLHPAVLSEGAASLLADGRERPAITWCIDLDADGVMVSWHVERSLVRSRAQLSYTGAQADLDAGRDEGVLGLLREVGQLRQRAEAERGGVSLNLPEQEVVPEQDTWHLRFRAPQPVEGWNAQISLLTGICAARMMLDAGVGVLRTLPPAQQRDVDRLRHIARSLGLSWPGSVGYPDFVRSLDPVDPDGQAMLNACTLLFRGAGYTVIDSSHSDRNSQHAALATPYAHTTAPLRRLIDRYTGNACADLAAGRPVGEWVASAFGALPDEMTDSDRRAKKFERGTIDLVEALVLHDRVGQRFDGTIIDVDDRRTERGVASIRRVAVEAPVEGQGLRLGAEQALLLRLADLEQGRVLFELA
ncbi:RNB domain-containing ribonuclease [Brooklawnia cerclae]|uniref:Exoribonuclease R n=1 Tax=Brooklawnia cerclae TaxID=349934 RepID=A0ABX0SGW6_9ACTN|nr:RNB domain-containing ribonuclease [Brooklawnia cerclae]NIH57635.1 exoribonuclease R [Brooklawnia cerclae]